MTSRSPRLVGLALVLSLLAVSRAAATTIDFESLSESDLVTTQFPGLTFSGATVLTAGSGLNEFEFPPSSGVNVIFDDGGQIRVDFTTPVSSFGGFFTYVTPVTLSAYTAANSLLGSVSSLFGSNLGLSGDIGSSPNEFLQVTFANMAYVTITGDAFGGSLTADDITVREAVDASVPEPGTIGLVLFGAGALFRRRTSRVVHSTARHK